MYKSERALQVIGSEMKSMLFIKTKLMNYKVERGIGFQRNVVLKIGF